MVLIWSRRLPPQSSLSRLKVSRCQILQARPCHVWASLSLLKPMTNGCDESAFMRGISRISLWNLQAKDDMFSFGLMTIQDLPLQPQLRSRPFFIPTTVFPIYSWCLIFFWAKDKRKGFHGWIVYSKERDLRLVRVHCHCIMNVQESTSPSKRQVLNCSVHSLRDCRIVICAANQVVLSVRVAFCGFHMLYFLVQAESDQIFWEDGVKVLWIAALWEQLREEVKLRSPPQEVGQAHRLNSVDNSTPEDSR